MLEALARRLARGRVAFTLIGIGIALNLLISAGAPGGP